MKSFLIIASIFLSSLTFAQEVAWKSLKEAEEIVKKNPEKQIMLFFYADWCGYCKKMDAETFKDQASVDYINANYVPVRYNAESKEKLSFLGYNYSYIPKGKINAFAFFLLNGRVSFPGTTVINKDSQIKNSIVGYMKPAEFIDSLKNPI